MEELMMRKIEQRIYSILAPATIQIYPFVTSCERIAKLLFEDEIPVEIYPDFTMKISEFV